MIALTALRKHSIFSWLHPEVCLWRNDGEEENMYAKYVCVWKAFRLHVVQT